MSDDKFWEKVVKGHGCWEYKGAINTSGYGWLSRRRKQMSAHRWVWILVHGEIPRGMHVLHRCDNARCVNPDHLYLGTHTDNMLDRADRRRTRRQKLTHADVAAIRAMRQAGHTCQAIADKYGISNGHVSAVARRLHYGRE